METAITVLIWMLAGWFGVGLLLAVTVLVKMLWELRK